MSSDPTTQEDCFIPAHRRPAPGLRLALDAWALGEALVIAATARGEPAGSTSVLVDEAANPESPAEVVDG